MQEAVRAETERNAPARRAEAQQETTGPPENKKAPRFSLNVYSEQQKENWKRSKKIIVYENALIYLQVPDTTFELPYY